MVMNLRFKRGADAVAAADADNTSASKRQQSEQPAASLDESDSDSDSDSVLEHHRWPVEHLSNLTITLQDGNTLHHFHAHQQTLACSCQYFATLIDNADSEAHMLVDLPGTFEWKPAELQQWLDICYGTYNQMSIRLAHASSMKAFAEMLLRVNAVVTVHDQTDADGVNLVWTVTVHNDLGESDVYNAAQTRTKSVVPSTCVLSPTQTVFSELQDNMDVTAMFEIAHYFVDEHITLLLSNVLMNFVKTANADLLVPLAAVAETFTLGEMRAACIERLRNCRELDASDVRCLKSMSADFLVELFVATSGAKVTD